VGVAIDPGRIPLGDPGLQALVRANTRALETINEVPHLAVDYISSFLPRLTRTEVAQFYERYVHPYFSRDGHVDFGVATTAVSAVAEELEVAVIPSEAIYRVGC